MINLNIDLGPLVDLNNELKPKLDIALKNAAQSLAAQAHAHILEQVQQKLHSTRQTYADALGFQQVNDTTWVINLDRNALWIEEGMCVLYGNRRTAPKVLTPDGPVPCTDIKEGALVLNQFGKWTKVMRVYDRNLFAEWEEEPVDMEIFNSLSPRSKKDIEVRCKSCKRTRHVSKFVFSQKGSTICPVCKKPPVYRVFVPKDNGYSLWLTEDHKVLTSDRGWVMAKELMPADTLLAPYWGKCKGCQQKTLWGRDWCSSGCAASQHNNEKLKNGTHTKGGRISGAEEQVARFLETHGQSVSWFGEGDADWVRQYRFAKGHDKLGRQTYFFGDFVSHKHKLVIEVDGKVFHSQEKDSERDALIKSKFGYQTIRIPANKCYRPTVLEPILQAILANHTEDIEFRPISVRVERHVPDNGFSLIRRWDITVESGSSFVCQGVVIHNSEHSMLDNLLRSPKAKMSKSGSKYLVVPFQHNKGPTQQTQAATDLTNTIKQELKKRQIPYGKIERDAKGQARTGLLHSFDIMKEPVKAHEGAGMGHGAVGAVRQGSTGIPFLQSVRIYQRNMGGKMQRGIMTFRVASSKHKGTEKWIHPGLEPRRFMDEAADWSLGIWEQMRNEILKEFNQL